MNKDSLVQNRFERRVVRARQREILARVLSRGFGSLWPGPVHSWRKATESDSLSKQRSRWSQVRLLLEDLGPTFVKMGQIFSNRPDLLPENLLIELRKLQDSVQAFPFETVRAIVESELESPLEKKFLSFDPVPVASASIAQVHKAQLPDGRTVAVKVLRPHVEENVALDLEILSRIGFWFEKIVLRSDVLDTRAILDEFARTLSRETDFRNEALYQIKFALNFKDDPDILVPKVYRELSTRRILVMDFVVGIHPLDWQGYVKAGLSRKQIAQRGAELLLKQVFVHGFFHADPHTGNILILTDGRVAFLDFGMMGVLFDRHRDHLAEMLLAISSNDATGMSKALLALAGNPPLENANRLEEDVFTLLETYAHLPLGEVNLGEFLQKVISILLQYRLTLPPTIYLLVKAFITIEGFARQLDPEFELLTHLEPFVRKVFTEKLNFWKASGANAESLMSYVSLIKDFPQDFREGLALWKKGKVRLEFVPDDLENILHKADRISNRLSFALIVTGTILASAMTLGAKIPPLWNGIPIFSIIALSGSGLLGFALLISIWRSGRF
jgi:ubiquinone biosynthesis protein